MSLIYENIYDHSPMDDYRKVKSQAKYTITYAPNAADTKSSANEKALYQNSAYKLVNKLATIFLIISFVLIACFLAVATADIITHGRYIMLNDIIHWLLFGICMGLILSAIFKFGITGLMENVTKKREDKSHIGLKGKTWVLSSGKVVVSDEQSERTSQKGMDGRSMPMAEAPFKRMIIIEKVYSVTRADGIIAAEADICELYRIHPYMGSCSDSHSEIQPEDEYFYRRRYRKTRVYWYENMYGREFFLRALNDLK